VDVPTLDDVPCASDGAAEISTEAIRFLPRPIYSTRPTFRKRKRAQLHKSEKIWSAPGTRRHRRHALLVVRRLAAAAPCSRPPPALDQASRSLGSSLLHCPHSLQRISVRSTRHCYSAREDGRQPVAIAARGLPCHWSRQAGLRESSLLRRPPPPSYPELVPALSSTCSAAVLIP